MPLYEIELYELHVQKYHIAAVTEAQAIQQLFAGGGDAVPNSLAYIEVCQDFGLSADEFPELAGELRALGMEVSEEISGIRNIETLEQPP